MSGIKKRELEIAFQEDVQIEESQLSFRLAKALMDVYSFGNNKFSKRMRSIRKNQGVDFFERKCIQRVAWNLSKDNTSGPTSSSVPGSQSASKAMDTSSSSEESSTSSGSGDEVSVAKKARTSNINGRRNQAAQRYMVYSTVNGEKKSIYFKLGREDNIELKLNPEDPNPKNGKNQGLQTAGSDYKGPHSLQADEKLEPKSFSAYVEPNTSELEAITEDVLEFGSRALCPPSLSGDSSPLSSSTEDESSSSEEIVNLQPLNKKPRFEFSPSSSLSSRLPDFLASMKAANENLQTNIAAGMKDHLLEIDGAVESKAEDEAEGESDQAYIEMDLGLGVVEETANCSDSSESSSNEVSDNEVKGGISSTGQTTSRRPVIIEELS